jgi:hypothetical protein
MSKFIKCWYSINKGKVLYVNTDKIVKFDIKANSSPNFFYIDVYVGDTAVALPFRSKEFNKYEDEYEAYTEAKEYLKKYIEELNK